MEKRACKHVLDSKYADFERNDVLPPTAFSCAGYSTENMTHQTSFCFWPLKERLCIPPNVNMWAKLNLIGFLLIYWLTLFYVHLWLLINV